MCAEGREQCACIYEPSGKWCAQQWVLRAHSPIGLLKSPKGYGMFHVTNWHSLFLLFFLFFGTGDETQGLMHARQPLYTEVCIQLANWHS